MKGNFKVSSELKAATEVDCFYLYFKIDKQDLMRPNFSYWVDLEGLGRDVFIEMSGSYRQVFDIDPRQDLKKDYEDATGINSEEVPDELIWEAVPGEWVNDGGEEVYEYRTDLLTNPPWTDVESDGGTVGAASVGSFDSWHPSSRVAYVINSTGTVEWGESETVWRKVSGGTQCAWTNANGESGHTGWAPRTFGYARGISAQAGNGEKFGATYPFIPIRYFVDSNAAYASCWHSLQHPSFSNWYYRPGRGPSPFVSEVHYAPDSIKYNITECSVGFEPGAGNLYSFRTFNAKAGGSTVGPGKHDPGKTYMSGYEDCHGIFEEVVPPMLYRKNPGHGGNNRDKTPKRAPSKGGGDFTNYYNPPESKKTVKLPPQPSVKVYLGSASGSEDILVHKVAAGEFFSRFPLDLLDYTIEDPERPDLDVHPITKLIDRCEQWLPTLGTRFPLIDNYGKDFSDSSIYDGTIDAPTMDLMLMSHQLIVVSPRHQIIVMKLGAFPLYDRYFGVQRIELINVFDGTPEVFRFPIEKTEQFYEYNLGLSEDYPLRPQPGEVWGTQALPERFDKYLRDSLLNPFDIHRNVVFSYRKFGGMDYVVPYDPAFFQQYPLSKNLFGTADVISDESDWFSNSGDIRIDQGTDAIYYTRDGEFGISKDVVAYLLTASYKFSTRTLLVCCGVGDQDWELNIGSVVPTRFCKPYTDLLDSGTWLYLCRAWTSFSEPVELKFIVHHGLMGEKYRDINSFGVPNFLDRLSTPYGLWSSADGYSFSIEVDRDTNKPVNDENYETALHLFGNFLANDFIVNKTDYGYSDTSRFLNLRAYPIIPLEEVPQDVIDELIDNNDYDKQPEFMSFFSHIKKDAVIAKCSVDFSKANASPTNSALLMVAAVTERTGDDLLVDRLSSHPEDKEDIWGSGLLEERFNMIADTQDFYRNFFEAREL